jgi:hypothetical protein
MFRQEYSYSVSGIVIGVKVAGADEVCVGVAVGRTSESTADLLTPDQLELTRITANTDQITAKTDGVTMYAASVTLGPMSRGRRAAGVLALIQSRSIESLATSTSKSRSQR